MPLHRALRALLPALVFIGAVMAFPPVAAATPPPTLDADAQQVLREMQIPGLAISIVKDGELVAAKGYGVRRLGESAAVDGDTSFPIASLSKAFTAVALCMLVDEGKLSWTDPVTKHLPAFQMWDPYVTREITVRDLLIHNSGLGLGAGDLMWVPPTNFSADELVERIRYLRPVSSFRSRYAYDNVLYVVAGQIVAAVAGQPWLQTVQERILRRVGMTATTADAAGLLAKSNHATPHGTTDDDRLTPIPAVSTSNVLAAAGLNSTAVDMARWMIVLLAQGQLPGARTHDDKAERLYSAARARDLWSIWTPISIGEPAFALSATKPEFLGYGLGFNVTDYRGRKVLTHNGTLNGSNSRLMLVPSLNLGVVVMTNQWHSDHARRALILRVVDHYLGVPETDWVSAYNDLEKSERAQARAKVAAAAALRPQQPGPVLSAQAFAGTYVDAWLGEATIAQEGSTWVLRFARSPGLVGDLEHWQGQTFVARWRDRMHKADAFVSFVMKPDASVAEIRMEAVSDETDFSFDFHDLKLVPAKPSNK
jgi:CubicO group peptidase (beta-lactamase class C family)